MPRDGPDVKHRINKEGWFMQYDQIAYVPSMLKKNGDDGYITYADAFFTYSGCGTQTGIADWAEHSCGRLMPIMTDIRRI
jgi:hypothetical protein